MCLIFLDIDGVLNSIHSIKRNYQKGYKKNADEIFMPQSVFLINMLIKVKKASVVISSTWRYDMDRVFKTFKLNNLNTKSIIGKTPFLKDNRGAEIYEYLTNHKKISDFVIIDDDKDMEPYMDKLIHVDRQVGFSRLNYIESLKKLK